MPIHERDVWRLQYFVGTQCPADVHIPTDDIDAYRWNEAHRWVYNKLRIAESQGIACAPHGVDPPCYPVFSKPIINLEGMGVGSCRLDSEADYVMARQPGHMRMEYLEGEHISTDAAVVRGEARWFRHCLGRAAGGGTFDYWTVEASPRRALEDHCVGWIGAHLGAYTGMVNLESIGNRIIEVHLRFADQWPDLYGPGWLDAVVELYAGGVWRYPDQAPRAGFSVVLFGPHGREYAHPGPSLVAELRAWPEVSSVQITFDEARPAADHAMPPGGFRLAIVNAWDLDAGRRARNRLAAHFGAGVRGA